MKTTEIIPIDNDEIKVITEILGNGNSNISIYWNNDLHEKLTKSFFVELDYRETIKQLYESKTGKCYRCKK